VYFVSIIQQPAEINKNNIRGQSPENISFLASFRSKRQGRFYLSLIFSLLFTGLAGSRANYYLEPFTFTFCFMEMVGRKVSKWQRRRPVWTAAFSSSKK